MHGMNAVHLLFPGLSYSWVGWRKLRKCFQFMQTLRFAGAAALPHTADVEPLRIQHLPRQLRVCGRLNPAACPEQSGWSGWRCPIRAAEHGAHEAANCSAQPVITSCILWFRCVSEGAFRNAGGITARRSLALFCCWRVHCICAERDHLDSPKITPQSIHERALNI